MELKLHKENASKGSDQNIGGDDGFRDSYNALKHQIDFNYSEYNIQLKSLDARRQMLKHDYMYSIKMLIVDLLIPIIYILLIRGCIYLGYKLAVFSIISIIMVLATPIVFFVFDIFLALGMLRNVVSYNKQILILNSGAAMADYRKNNGIISFEDEKAFLNNEIGRIEEFYRDMENKDYAEGDHVRILDRMRSLSLFKEYRAAVYKTKEKIGWLWIFVVLLMILEISAFIAVMNTAGAGIF